MLINYSHFFGGNGSGFCPSGIRGYGRGSRRFARRGDLFRVGVRIPVVSGSVHVRRSGRRGKAITAGGMPGGHGGHRAVMPGHATRANTGGGANQPGDGSGASRLAHCRITCDTPADVDCWVAGERLSLPTVYAAPGLGQRPFAPAFAPLWTAGLTPQAVSCPVRPQAARVAGASTAWDIGETQITRSRVHVWRQRGRTHTPCRCAWS